jgi:hypothetical protein
VWSPSFLAALIAGIKTQQFTQKSQQEKRRVLSLPTALFEN